MMNDAELKDFMRSMYQKILGWSGAPLGVYIAKLFLLLKIEWK